MYPLKFENLYYEKIWGGENFKKFRDNVAERNIGESWDVACHSNGVSVVSNGKYQGIPLDKLIEIKGADLLGTHINLDTFPLLIKLLSTRDKLSVQVHPDDTYALRHEGEMGKTEIWYIIDAKEDSDIILGTKGCTKEQFRKALEEENPERFMNKIKAKKGDVFYVKSGLIHSIGAGILLAEIQQNSDTTYRVYDYNRGRELHIDKALDVIDFTLQAKASVGSVIEGENYNKISYCSNIYFALELYDIKNYAKESSDMERFYIFTCVEGSGDIEYKNGTEKVNMGDSLLIPAILGEYKINGKLKLLKTYVPSKIDG